MAEQCNPCEIYRRICDMYRKVCFNQKDIYKWAKHGFATMNSSWKKESLVGKHTDSQVKKSSGSSNQ